ncbi:MAG TPA: penicillin-binding protein 2 [Actinotalea sp.]
MHPHRRQSFMLAGILAVLMVFSGRLVVVQAFQGPGLAETALAERLHTESIPGNRGDIVDAKGRVLATSVERWNIVVNQVQLAKAVRAGGADVSAAAASLEPLLGVPAAELGPKLVGDRQFRYLAKDLAPEVYHHVMALGLPGISGERTTDRLYPAGSTAGNVLGFVGADGTAQAGLEWVFQKELAGTAGSETYERGAQGQRIPTGKDTVVPAVDGADVQLTIDRDLQYMAQSALDAQVAATGAEWGAVEIVNVRTGEILTLADSGTVDPNDPSATPAERRQSRAAASAFEPGSTAKVITMAEILDSKVAEPTSQFVVPYAFQVPNGQTFHDSHEHADLHLTLTGILAESSNAGTVMVGQQVPRAVRHDYLAKFGFGQPTGAGLPGEASGMLRAAADWDGRSEYAVLFGQAVSVTTLQATQVFATLANDGVRVQPHIVKSVTDADGTVHPTTLAAPQQVVSPDTAHTLVRMLESAVTDGTGGHAAIPGYRIAGKTGTSQAFEGGGVQKNVASFIGIAPADNPQVVVSVVLYAPTSSIYGGDVAAPVFSQVAGYALQYLGVPPSGTQPDPFPTTW